MQPKPITHGNIFRVLTAGFGLVVILLLAAALVAVRNIHAIQQSATGLIGEQEVARRLIGELHGQQTSLSEVFSVLARDPDSVDEGAILKQLDTADADTARIAAEGARTADRDLWASLKQASLAFSAEARHILAEDEPETFAPVELFREHEDFMTVVARLVEREYRTAGAAQARLNQLTSELLRTTVIFAGASVLLALLFAVITVRMVSRLVRGMEWQTAELGRVSWHMLEDQEATARRFSHELHDELGQSLTAIKTNLAALAAGGEANAERTSDCLRLVDEATANVRQMSQLLRPTILDDFGLAASLRWQVEGFAARTGIDARFESNFDGRLPGETETHLFRIAQEALTNVARHAAAHRVTVTLTAEKGRLRLSVEDDGKGLAGTPAEGRGMGMIGMRARARIAGGELTERSQPGQGVLIEVRLPIPDETDSHSAG
ncbi:MAG TPA: sensor histidine kinase [Bryobacteraceae bacterium]|jgi:signal transduction histidine kinase